MGQANSDPLRPAMLSKKCKWLRNFQGRPRQAPRDPREKTCGDAKKPALPGVCGLGDSQDLVSHAVQHLYPSSRSPRLSNNAPCAGKPSPALGEITQEMGSAHTQTRILMQLQITRTSEWRRPTLTRSMWHTYSLYPGSATQAENVSHTPSENCARP